MILRKIGWVGIENDRAYFHPQQDEYCEDDKWPMECDIFKSKREALKRFEEVRAVYVQERKR
jgi:hypothetical protein